MYSGNSSGITSALLAILLFFAGYWVRNAGYVIRVDSPLKTEVKAK